MEEDKNKPLELKIGDEVYYVADIFIRKGTIIGKKEPDKRIPSVCTDIFSEYDIEMKNGTIFKEISYFSGSWPWGRPYITKEKPEGLVMLGF